MSRHDQQQQAPDVPRGSGLQRIGRHRRPEEIQPRPVPAGGLRWGVLEDPYMGLTVGGGR